MYHRQLYKHALATRILQDPRQKRHVAHRDLRDLFTLSDRHHGASTETGRIFTGISAQVTAADVQGGDSEEDVAAGTHEEHGAAAEVQQLPADAAAAEVAADVAESTAAATNGAANGTVSAGSDSEDSGAALAQPQPQRPLQRRPLQPQAPNSSPHIGRASFKSAARPRSAQTGKKRSRGSSRSANSIDAGSASGESDSEGDAAILKELFGGAGLHSTLNHSAVESTNDGARRDVEQQASKVAERAAAALHASRAAVRREPAHMCAPGLTVWGAQCASPWAGCMLVMDGRSCSLSWRAG